MRRSKKMLLVFLTAWLFAIVIGFALSTRHTFAQSCASCPFCDNFTQFGMLTLEDGEEVTLYGGQTLEGTKDNWKPSSIGGQQPSSCTGAYLYKVTCSYEQGGCSEEGDPEVSLQLWKFSSATYTCDVTDPTDPWVIEAKDGLNQTEYGTGNQKVCVFE